MKIQASSWGEATKDNGRPFLFGASDFFLPSSLFVMLTANG